MMDADSNEHMFVRDAMRGLEPSDAIPFSPTPHGRFLYLTNRKFGRYSWLYPDIDPATVHRDCRFQMGYTNLWLLEAVAFFPGFDTDAPLRPLASVSGSQHGNYIILQDPAGKLAEIDTNDIIASHTDCGAAEAECRALQPQGSVLLALKIAEFGWH